MQPNLSLAFLAFSGMTPRQAMAAKINGNLGKVRPKPQVYRTLGQIPGGVARSRGIAWHGERRVERNSRGEIPD